MVCLKVALRRVWAGVKGTKADTTKMGTRREEETIGTEMATVVKIARKVASTGGREVLPTRTNVISNIKKLRAKNGVKLKTRWSSS